jgi:preprotein translocase subunit YajC
MDLIVFLPLLLIIVGFMFFASRKQKKAMQATIDLHESLQVGDRVHTTAGLEATIAAITDDTVDLEIAPGVITTWMKLAIRDRILDDDDLDDEEDEDDTNDHVGSNDHVDHDNPNREITETSAIEEPRRLTTD